MRLQNSHTRTKRVVRATLIATLTVGLMAGSVFAGKPAAGGGKGKPGGGTGGTGTISAPVLIDSTDSAVNHGDWIRFNVSTASTTEPWVRLYCYQGGTLVAQGFEGYFERSLDDGVFGLYSQMWTSGDADCTAKLSRSLTAPSWRPRPSTSTPRHVFADGATRPTPGIRRAPATAGALRLLRRTTDTPGASTAPGSVSCVHGFDDRSRWSLLPATWAASSWRKAPRLFQALAR